MAYHKALLQYVSCNNLKALLYATVDTIKAIQYSFQNILKRIHHSYSKSHSFKIRAVAQQGEVY